MIKLLLNKVSQIFIIIVPVLFLKAQFVEITYELKTQNSFNENGLKWFEDFEEDEKDRKELIELYKNPPVLEYKFLYNSKNSYSEYTPKIDNSQVASTYSITEYTPTYGQNAFFDYEEQKFYSQENVYDKKYVSYGDIYKLNLTETGNIKKVLGIEVKEIRGKIDKYDIIAWYTPTILFNYSPDIFFTDKGLILELHFKFSDEKGEKIISWIPLKINHLKKEPKILKPNKGKLIESSNMSKIWEEVNEKMNELFN